MKKDWLKHAFYVEGDGPFEPDETQKKALDKLCKGIIRRGLTTPAIIGVEMGRPLKLFGLPDNAFFHSADFSVCTNKSWSAVAEFLEHRGSVDWIRNRIEELENELDEESKTNENPKL